MEYRYISHTVFKIEYHFVFVIKYTFEILKGDIGIKLRDLINMFEIDIKKKQ